MFGKLLATFRLHTYWKGVPGERQVGLELTAQLTDGATGTHIWAKRYDRALEDIFAVQDDLTESIFAAVVPELGAAERERARAKRPESLTAWDWYQRGMSHLYRRTKYDVSEAERLFNLALELDNTLVPALCALSEVHYFQTFFGQSSEVAFHRLEAKRLADRAVNLDNQDPGAYCALARANMMSGDHGTASSYAETALALNPASALALYLLGMSHLYDGRANEGLPHIESAIRLSPHDQYAGRFMAAIAEGNLFLGEYEKAARVGEAFNAPAEVKPRPRDEKQRLPLLWLNLAASTRRDWSFKNSSESGPASRYASCATTPADEPRISRPLCGGSTSPQVSPNDHPPPRRDPVRRRGRILIDEAGRGEAERVLLAMRRGSEFSTKNQHERGRRAPEAPVARCLSVRNCSTSMTRARQPCRLR